jgi:hypothetical protein
VVEFGCFTWNVNIEVSFGCSASGHGVVVFLLISQLHSIGVPRGTANQPKITFYGISPGLQID